MQVGRIEFSETTNEIRTHIIVYRSDSEMRAELPLSIKDLAHIFGFEFKPLNFPPVADLDTLHRRNATAIKRRLKCN